MKPMTNQCKEHAGYNSVAIFIRLAVAVSQICEIPRAVHGHPRSFILMSIESAYATFY